VRDLDKKLLTQEGPGILAWAVRGCLDWQTKGLADPTIVCEATGEYRAEMDAIGTFLDERCECHVEDPASRVRATVLYQAYVAWATANKVVVVPSKKFGTYMEQRGFILRKSNGICWRRGLALKAVTEDDADMFR